MSAPLGELALRAGLVEAGRLEALLRIQERWRAEGNLRRLGEVLVESLRVPAGQVRRLLRAQGLELVSCQLCLARFGAIGRVAGVLGCPRCGRPLDIAPPEAALTVEDTLADPSPAAQGQLADLRRRAPRLGRFEVVGELGRGGMGVLYKAHDPSRGGPPVALKFLLQPDVAGHEGRERFRREARALASLRHPHIVPSVGLDESAQAPCIVMDYVPGVTLDVLLARGAVSLPRLVWVCACVARALDHAHRAGLVHRDVKPGNVLIDRGGRPLLFDFGIAKDANESQSLTAEGMALGSLVTMAPEYLLQGVSAVGPACDIYGVGVMLYLAAAGGQHPFGDPQRDDFSRRVVEGTPTPLARLAPGLPPPLLAAIDRAVSHDPGRRQPGAAALADELEACLPLLGAPGPGGMA